MQFIKDFFKFLYEEMIDLDHLDAIHNIARHHTDLVECRAFEEWYKANIVDDQDDE